MCSEKKPFSLDFGGVFIGEKTLIDQLLDAAPYYFYLFLIGTTVSMLHVLFPQLLRLWKANSRMYEQLWRSSTRRSTLGQPFLYVP
jgi:hypothetical protein